MNTSKQVNVMIGVVLLAFLLFSGYIANEARRADEAKEEITEKVAERGARLFVRNCRGCHGLEGEGNVAPPLNREGFLLLREGNKYGLPASPQGDIDLVQNFLTNTIACGRTNTFMPLWGQRFGGSLSDTQIQQLVTLITEGRWDLVREEAALDDPALFADSFIPAAERLPNAAEMAKLPLEEQLRLRKAYEAKVAVEATRLEHEIAAGNYPDVMKKGAAAVLVQDASTLALTEKNCGQFTADGAAEIHGRTPLAAAPGPAETPAPGASGTPSGGGGGGSGTAAGRQLATQQGCAACHTTGGTAGVGPTWKGLAGSQRQLVDGSTVTADDNYLRESITSPNAKIAKGCIAGNCSPGIMPQDFGTKLTPAQIDQLIEYIKTLK